jgi:hypothetical protein
MLRFVKQIVWLLGVLIGCQSAFGFALLGPVPTAATQPDGFQFGGPGQNIGYNVGGGEAGVPKDIKEEYRRNTPVVYYAFDEAFRDYFGDIGVQEIDKAMAIYNSVGKSSQLNIDDYPMDSRRVNFRAQADGLLDLKSFTMGLMTEQVGLFEPTRWVWTLHDRQVNPPIGCPGDVTYLVFQRNFNPDPVGTDNYPTTSYVNGVLYSYFILEFCTGPAPLADAIEFPVDPLASPYSAVADFSSLEYAGLPVGGFYTSLTRDDVAGLKYLLATNNVNGEHSGGRTTEFITNAAPAAIQTFDLGTFAAQARVNTAAALQALYPGLIITSTSNFFGLTITTNITQILVSAPTDPAGIAPSHPIFSTNYTTNFANFFSHTFGNIVTNTFSTIGLAGTVTLGLSVPPFAPAGTVPTTTTIVKLGPVGGVFGDFFIVPTNFCGARILSNLLTTVTGTTNPPTQIVGPATNAITFIPGSVNFTTNHVVVYLPVSCPLDSIAKRGGVDRLIFVRRDYDALVGQGWDPVTNDYTMTELDETNAVLVLRHFQRRVPRPDILFSAADFATEGGANYSNTVDNAFFTVNISISGIGVGQVLTFSLGGQFDPSARPGPLAGPGTIIDHPVIPTLMIFNKLAPVYDNESSTAPFLTPNEPTQIKFAGWGSFDGTTNAPVVYPNGTSLQEFENQIIGPAASTRYLPDGTIGSPYFAQLAGVGGVPPYTWSLAPGSPGLPAGLNISSNGKITGIPSGPASIYDFTVRITDSLGAFRDVQFTITIIN